MPHLQRSRGRLGTKWGLTSLGIPKIHSDTNGSEREKPLKIKGFKEKARSRSRIRGMWSVVYCL